MERKNMENKEKLSHLNAEGVPGMVDISAKETTSRTATATSIVFLGKEILQHLEGGEIQTRKGGVFQTAIIAGTQATKQTSLLIPFCHQLPLTKCELEISPLNAEEVQIFCTVKTNGQTGVEMEALTGASVAALTLYDMCKAMSKEIEIKSTYLLSKTGGKSGDFTRKKA